MGPGFVGTKPNRPTASMLMLSIEVFRNPVSQSLPHEAAEQKVNMCFALNVVCLPSAVQEVSTNLGDAL